MGGGNGEEYSPMGGDSGWMAARGELARFFVGFFFSMEAARKILFLDISKIKDWIDREENQEVQFPETVDVIF